MKGFHIAALLLSFVFSLRPTVAGAAAAKKPQPTAKPDASAATESIEALAERARKSVAVITHYARNGKEDGIGSGVVIGSNLIATCFHVIGEARPVSNCQSLSPA